MIGKIRPQILTAIICATIFSMFATWVGLQMMATEIVTAIIGGIFGFLGGVSLRIIESEGPDAE
tara:strand:- start:252 stop:443 length:192 start_codon:yes stop_codon:yes gene_type:complete